VKICHTYGDGTAVDIVLNPLGVPSRMNVGQILETALGLVGTKMGEQLQQLNETKGYEEVKKYLGYCYGSELIAEYEKSHGKDGILELARTSAQYGVRFETPVFDGADFDSDIKPLMENLKLPVSGAFDVFDGRTGEKFDQPVTVGNIYMMKLNHMVDDKLHARSVGPYSLVTQQPLGGKAQQGGQRLGEMEVWALEAYGAAYTRYKKCSHINLTMWVVAIVHMERSSVVRMFLNQVSQSHSMFLLKSCKV
jgi:DNA-directed RNA polymerase subunit beta